MDSLEDSNSFYKSRNLKDSVGPKMIKILVEVIDHCNQRYPTVGDWWFEVDRNFNEVIHICVSKIIHKGIHQEYMEFAVALHELVEAILCRYNGVSEYEVTKFDEEHPEADEPGALIDAPYFKEHAVATQIEKMLVEQFSFSWEEYDEAVRDCA